jgi:hypothetical protein
MTPPTGNGAGRRLALLILPIVAVLALGGALLWSALAGGPAPKAPAETTAAVGDTTALPHRVIAYYFHTTMRCASCMKIEAYTTEAIQTAFPDELKNGRLVLKVVNVEETGNEHFVKDYQLYTKSVVLVDERAGKQMAWKNLAKVWQLLNDKEGFLRYVQDETRAHLSDERS